MPGGTAPLKSEEYMNDITENSPTLFDNEDSTVKIMNEPEDSLAENITENEETDIPSVIQNELSDFNVERRTA